MAFTYRLEKGSELTEYELDENFREVARIASKTSDEIRAQIGDELLESKTYSEASKASADEAKKSEINAAASAGVVGPQVREALRRSYAEAGLNLVSGSFEDGATLTDPQDVLLQRGTGKCFNWQAELPVGGKSIPAGSTPESTGGIGINKWQEVTGVTRYSQAQHSDGVNYKTFYVWQGQVTLQHKDEAVQFKQGGMFYRWDGAIPQGGLIIPQGTPGPSPSQTGKGKYIAVLDMEYRAYIKNGPVYVTDTRFAGGANPQSINNDDAINLAISEAISTGNQVYWPAVYEVQGNIPNFHSVRHVGPGGIKRGDDTFFVSISEQQTNNLYISEFGLPGNDGLTSSHPVSSIQSALDWLKKYNLKGSWNLNLVGFVEAGIITGLSSDNPITIIGQSVPAGAMPTSGVDMQGTPTQFGLWIGNEMRVNYRNILVKNIANGSGLASGFVVDAGCTSRFYNCWTRNCEQNGINCNVRSRIVVEGAGDYQAGFSSIRVYGTSTAYIGFDGSRIITRDATNGVEVTGSSYSHSDNIDFKNHTFGIWCRFESHSTDYNNTFDNVSVAREATDACTINSANSTYITEPSVSRGRKQFGLLGQNDQFSVPNRDLRNIQYYPFLGNGRYAFGYDQLYNPFKRWNFSLDGTPSVIDWSSAGGVDFIIDRSTGNNFFAIGAVSPFASGYAMGDNTSPTRCILKHQGGVFTTRIDGVDIFRVAPTSFGPYADNVATCGTASIRTKEYFGVSGAINTSDAREKTPPEIISDAMLDAADDISISVWRWISAVALKGEESARWHFGPIAQQVRDAFSKHGLNGCDYGLLCYDEWEDQFEDVTKDVIQEDGSIIPVVTGEKRLVIAAGNRWGIRPDQCLWLKMAATERRCARIEDRLRQLEIVT